MTGTVPPDTKGSAYKKESIKTRIGPVPCCESDGARCNHKKSPIRIPVAAQHTVTRLGGFSAKRYYVLPCWILRRQAFTGFMAEERVNRKLAAILAADVVGYSRLMASDEEGTLAALKRHRQTVFEPAVAAHQGRIVKLIGDGTIVEFASVVDAVNCAVSVQRSGDSSQDESLSEPKIVLRIGINLGDVIIEGRGSNIVNPQPHAAIAILPFTNMSGDPEQEYFSDGISEDIITDLSKIAGLIVIARNSSFAYKGRSVDVRTIGHDLGVQSVLEGSIRRSGNRLRITAQLIDATSGGHLWADRYDRDLTDIFEVQDDVTRRIVDALKVTLSPAEKKRLADTKIPNLAAYDYALRGREVLLGKEKSRETFEQAIMYFKKALEQDPNYSLAYARLGIAHILDYQNRWTDDPDNSLPLAKQYAREALEKDPNEPLARCVSAMTASFEKDLDRAKSEIDVALSLNPNFALAHNLRGSNRIYSGQPLEAIPEIEQAMRLDPASSPQFLHFLGMAYLLAGKYETAAVLLRQRIVLVPRTDFSRALLASALGHLGEIEEARQVWKELKEINPNYAFAEHVGRQPFRRKEDVGRIAGSLKKAGLLN
jgi:TolB-like protein/Tfp pilus assembly protein PilF